MIADHENIIEIEKNIQDPVLTEKWDGKRFDYKAMIKVVEQIKRPLTEEEAEQYRIQ